MNEIGKDIYEVKYALKNNDSQIENSTVNLSYKEITDLIKASGQRAVEGK